MQVEFQLLHSTNELWWFYFAAAANIGVAISSCLVFWAQLGLSSRRTWRIFRDAISHLQNDDRPSVGSLLRRLGPRSPESGLSDAALIACQTENRMGQFSMNVAQQVFGRRIARLERLYEYCLFTYSVLVLSFVYISLDSISVLLKVASWGKPFNDFMIARQMTLLIRWFWLVVALNFLYLHFRYRLLRRRQMWQHFTYAWSNCLTKQQDNSSLSTL